MPRFQGKVAVITGSSSGIGAATAVLFAKEGAQVTITGRNQDGLVATKKAMLNAGANEGNLNMVIADVTDSQGRKQIISSTIEKFGQLDILVNNAGAAISGEDGTSGISASTVLLEKVMKLNVYSVVDMIQLARPYLAKTKGEVINISSICGQPTSYAPVAYYAMSKAALDQMMRSAAIDLIKEGIRVNGVSPGVVVTQFAENMLSNKEIAKQFYETFANKPGALPCGKVAVPSDIANVIAFLADRSQSSYIVGQTIVADGGTSIVLASNADSAVPTAK
ncbi:unnamed protein product [Cylicocyclus nassatus]|uniref:Uncharacterized protein n=1 Tax=Cylicocyclus nassatus TaxID=53992 RepID=A0AA36MCH0_CYLNA|nr:unnamed protein product [Cylicocyclus nassatus]